MPVLVIGAIALAIFGIIGGLLSLAVIMERKAAERAQQRLANADRSLK